jgi:hypothetical protein
VHLLRDLGKHMIGRNAFSIRYTAQVVFEDSPISMTAVAKLKNYAPRKVPTAIYQNLE